MHIISTRFTQRLGIKSPIVLAPIYYASDAKLVIAVTAAGGFAFLPAGFDSPKKLIDGLNTIRRELNIPSGEPLPVGVGFLGWILDRTETSEEPRITAILDQLPIAIWLAFGVDLGKYVKQIREYDQKRNRKTLIFVIINSTSEAVKAANEWGVDALVVQGYEAGGHGGARAPPLFNLLTDVLTVIPRSENSPLIIAAGGISTGAQVASLLVQGADAVACGTRFLFTPECIYSEEMKTILLRTDLNGTTRCCQFDEVGGTPPKLTWPEGIDGRAVTNKIIEDYEEGASLEERQKRFDESKERKESDRLLIWAGVGAGHVKEIKPAVHVLTELHDEALAALRATQALL